MRTFRAAPAETSAREAASRSRPPAPAPPSPPSQSVATSSRSLSLFRFLLLLTVALAAVVRAAETDGGAGSLDITARVNLDDGNGDSTYGDTYGNRDDACGQDASYCADIQSQTQTQDGARADSLENLDMVSPGTSLVGLGLGGGGNASGGGGARYRAPRPPLDVAGYPVAPRELELEQVHVYVRHGERLIDFLKNLWWAGGRGLVGLNAPSGTRYMRVVDVLCAMYARSLAVTRSCDVWSARALRSSARQMACDRHPSTRPIVFVDHSPSPTPRRPCPARPLPLPMAIPVASSHTPDPDAPRAPPLFFF